jgi:hypothetical protein
MFAQFSHLIHCRFIGFVLFALTSALGLVPLFLLPCVFFLPFCKRRSSSRHNIPYLFFIRSRPGALRNRTGIFFAFELPARFARLPWMTAIIIAPTTATTATKTLASASTTATAPGTVSFGLGLIDGQGPSAQIGPIERSDRLVGLVGIGHFDEAEAAGATRIPIGDERDLFYRAMCLEDIPQL